MKNLIRIIGLVGAAMGIFFTFSSVFAAPNNIVTSHPGKISKPSVNGAYFVSFGDNLSRSDIAKLIRSVGGKVKYNYRHQNVVAAYIPFENIDLIQSAGSVTDVVPDRLINAIGKPEGKGGKPPKDTSGQVTTEGVVRIGADLVSYTGAGVGVAIVDTGIDSLHTDLNVSPECFAASAYTTCDDDNGHGTHVGGIVAALDNSADVVGVAPDATLYSVKVLDATGSGYDSHIVEGLEWIQDVSDGLDGDDVYPPIRVVNMSLGRQGNLNDSSPLRTAISNLTDLGISIVVAAGNNPSLEVSQNVPATYPEVMAVASTTAINGSNKCRSLRGYKIKTDTASYFSTDGAYDEVTGIGVTISAPGENKEDISGGCFIQAEGILSTKLGGGTTRMYGTSMASPHVAGAVAVMWSKALDLGLLLDPEFVKATIRSTAELSGLTPIDSPSNWYTFDGEREGIMSVPNALSAF
ncbi:MAG: S8 family serine peptidase [Flavobacteriaceae bacterium]|nr:S8 family serine peptidase [Flavobacteriaceae bacterium]